MSALVEGALDLDLDLGIRDEWLRAATEPPEARGASRDDVRLLLQDPKTGSFSHHHFRALPDLLREGDLLVINRSRTLPASLPICAADGTPLRLHLAQRLAQGIYRAELRSEDGLHPLPAPAAGARFTLREQSLGTLVVQVLSRAHPASRQILVRTAGRRSLLPWMRLLGQPIRYAYVQGRWPLSAYQTIFAGPAGSAEMPSAARPLSREVLAGLKRRGVRLTFLTLHCGLSSEEVEEGIEGHYLPAEPYALPSATVQEIARATARGGRVIAVGTTVVRALQSACAGGALRPGRALAGALLRPGVRPCAVDALLTGMHAPKSSHLALLEAFVSAPLLRRAYLGAIAQGYRWHEFGDMHLILPDAPHAPMRYSLEQE